MIFVMILNNLSLYYFNTMAKYFLDLMFDDDKKTYIKFKIVLFIILFILVVSGIKDNFFKLPYIINFSVMHNKQNE